MIGASDDHAQRSLEILTIFAAQLAGIIQARMEQELADPTELFTSCDIIRITFS